MVVIATRIGAEGPGALILGAQHYVAKGQRLLGGSQFCSLDSDR